MYVRVGTFINIYQHTFHILTRKIPREALPPANIYLHSIHRSGAKHFFH
jgi:hypothetical protein